MAFDYGSTTELSPDEARLMNRTVYEKLASNDPMMVKEAEGVVNAYTRTKMREDSFMQKIIPPVPISNDELDRQVDTDNPVKIVDKEPDSPGAISVGFATLPQGIYIRGSRYRVPFDRILTNRFTKDVDQLRTWVMDIRQVLSDNAIKDMLAEIDGKMLAAVNTALIGPGVVCPLSGSEQYVEILGGITRDTLWDGLKVMPSNVSNLEVHTVLLNHLTIKEVAKFGRDEMGGDMSQDVMRKGWTESDFMGVRWIVTIKKDLVGNNTMYQFCDPAFIGKHFSLEETTMYIRREAFMLEFFCYQTSGAAFGHLNGLARVDYK